MPATTAADLGALRDEVVACRECPRLVGWRESVASQPRASFRGQSYWGRPVPGFGDPGARLLIVGLAPAAHGGNRTGRIFTGDRSGDFLFAALHRTGYANQAESVALDDGLRLRDAYMAAAVRCAPPANKPTPRERDECRPYLVREMDLLRRVRVVLVLGGFAYQAAWAALRESAGSRAGPAGRVALPARRPRFAHGLEVEAGRMTIVGCYHPSQQNTFTGRLTPEMLDAVLTRARHLTR